MRRIVLLVLAVCFANYLSAQNQSATWIWYPGDYEVWLSNDMQNRRTERGTFFPPFWKMDSHYVLVEFHKEFQLDKPEEISIYAEGVYNVKINGKMVHGTPSKLKLDKGTQKVTIKVHNQAHVPSLMVQGETVNTSKDWLVTFEDKEWIDETGKASDASGTTYVKVGYWNFNDPENKPSAFKLPTRLEHAVSVTPHKDGKLIDFGVNTFGFLTLKDLKGKGQLEIYYGESKEEALGIETCETLDVLDINNSSPADTTLENSKAFRYVYVIGENDLDFKGADMLYEYLPVEERGTFKSSNDRLNKIWDVANYTMELTSREFYIDGIKRDRWIWSGDAYQSYAMNYYLGFDQETVKRTIYALRGKEPTQSHINTIMDYSFYWFLSIYDYYLYTGDREFIEAIYPRMQTLMEFVLERRNKEGLMQGLAGDWVFVDWAEGLSKEGALSFEQLLLCRSLETMAFCAELVGENKEKDYYNAEAKELKDKIFNYYWNENKQAFVHSVVDGEQSDNVTRYTNMFAIFFDYLNDQQKQGVKSNVLFNDDVQKILTPYMRYYELEALCALDEKDIVMQEMLDYWGGMLDLGATTFWEEYNPEKPGADHYSMYGREFGKSLCHSWGASPIYLLGKYFIGVKPTSPAYDTYLIEPYLSTLEWMEGTVPTPQGDIKVHMDNQTLTLSAPHGVGTLRLNSSIVPTANKGEFTKVGDNLYEMRIDKDFEYKINYKK